MNQTGKAQKEAGEEDPTCRAGVKRAGGEDIASANQARNPEAEAERRV